MIKIELLLFLFGIVLTMVACSRTVSFENGMAENDVVDVKGVTAKGKRQFVIVARNPSGALVVPIYIQAMRRQIQVDRGVNRRYYRTRYVGPNADFRLVLRVHNRVLEIRMFQPQSFHVFLKVEYDLGSQVIALVKGLVGKATFRRARWENYVEMPFDCGRRIGLGIVPDTGLCPPTATEERIVGGSPAAVGAFPWQISLWERKRGETDFTPRCGGILIGNCWVLSAAHCIYGAAENYRVRVGDYYIRGDKKNSKFAEYEDSQNVAIDKIIEHEEYWTVPTSQNDIVLMRLKSNNSSGSCVTFGRLVQPACLPIEDTELPDGYSCFISGWGATQESQSSASFPGCLQQASVSLLTNSACKEGKKGYADDPAQGPRIRDSMVCTEGTGIISTDACQGDSGGPLICDQGSKAYVWGITSWGEGCGTHYGVYTRVVKFLDWIEKNMLQTVKYDPHRAFSN